MNMTTLPSTKEILLELELPEQTSSYKPVANQRIIQEILEGIDRNGFELVNEHYSIARKGLQSQGRYGLRYNGDKEMGLEVTWQNSYDKSVSFKLAVGAQVFVCTNGACYGSTGSFKKKHVGEIQSITPQRINEFLGRAGDDFEDKIAFRERMKTLDVSKRTAAELVGRMFIEEQIINATQLSIIKREIYAPSFEYNCEGSMWELYNHTTHAAKDSTPALWLPRHAGIQSFFEKVTA